MPPEESPAPEPGAPAAPAAPQAPAAPATQPTASEPHRLPDDHPLVKAYQATKQSLAEAKDKLRGHEDAGKSELEKLTEKVTAAEQRAAAAEVKLLRSDVAADKGLTPAQAKFLTGSTKEEMEAQADEILKAFPASGATPPPSKTPTPTLKGGSNPTEDAVDVKSLVDSIPPTA